MRSKICLKAPCRSGEIYIHPTSTLPQGQALLPSIKALQTTLTELQQLQQLKQAHWNVSGTLFYPLHELLQEHYEGVAKYADETAERLQSIGVSSDGRANTISRNSRIPNIRAASPTTHR